MKEIIFETTERNQLLNITKEVEKAIKTAPFSKGIVFLFVPHTTCSLTINEGTDPNITKDIVNFFNSLVKEGVWRHDVIDNNGAAHIKSTLLEKYLLIPYEDFALKLGTWQNIFLCEFDGPRKRKILISFIETK
ncbi:MAG: secondary thiamine-phosphate synthase enzyme YjbQ [Candidatus Woesearchaeota archaeon]